MLGRALIGVVVELRQVWRLFSNKPLVDGVHKRRHRQFHDGRSVKTRLRVRSYYNTLVYLSLSYEHSFPGATIQVRVLLLLS